jgi:IS605 OrfB family transposase
VTIGAASSRTTSEACYNVKVGTREEHNRELQVAAKTRAMRAFHTRLRLTPEQDAALRAAGALYGRALGMALAGVMRGEDPGKPDGGWTAHIDRSLDLGSHYADSAWLRADGLRKTTIAGYERAIGELESRASAADRTAEKLSKRLETARTPAARKKLRFEIHHAKRRAKRARDRADAKRAQITENNISICLGSARRASQRPQVVADKIARVEARQARIGRRGTIRVAQTFETHDEWLADWKAARGSELFSTGNAAVAGGNSMIIVTEQDDGTFTLAIKLPRSLHAAHGRVITLAGLTFPYGSEQLRGALQRNQAVMAENRRCKTLGGKRAMRERDEPINEIYGGSIAWRIKNRNGAWYAICSIGEEHDQIEEQPGAIGVDYNDGFLAVAELGGDGNAARRDLHRIDIPSYGGSQAQRRDAMNKAVRQLVDVAIRTSKPIVIETLDFKAKKAALRDAGYVRNARMLSALAYSAFRTQLQTTASRAGIRVIEVNPAYTSFMGRVRYAQQLGTDVHHAAAICIARRGLRFSERATPYAGRTIAVPGVRDHVAFQAPDGIPGKHVWSWWRRCSSEYVRAHEAQRSMRGSPQRIDTAKTLAIDASLSEDGNFLSSVIEGSVATATGEVATDRPPASG